MTRVLVLAAVLASGCGEHGSSRDAGGDQLDVPIVIVDAPKLDVFVPIDAPPGVNPGFAEPAGLVQAWTESSGTFQAAALDLTCLGLARSDTATNQVVSVTANIHDFQSGNALPNAAITAFAGTNPAAVLATATANGSGAAQLSIPAGTKRLGYQVMGTNSRPTYTFDTLLFPLGSQLAVNVESLSNATAQTLPALIGVSASPTGAIVIGLVTDCQGHTLSSTIATVSSVPATATHLTGVDTYYFSESVGLPVRHSQAPSSTKNGLFMVIEVPASQTAFVQVWGFMNASDQAMHRLQLLAQLAVPVPSASALFATFEPHATN